MAPTDPALYRGCIRCSNWIIPLSDGSSPYRCARCGPAVVEVRPGVYRCGSYARPTKRRPACTYTVNETGPTAVCSCPAWHQATGCKHLDRVRAMFEWGCISGQSRGVVHGSIIPPIRPLQTIPPVAA